MSVGGGCDMCLCKDKDHRSLRCREVHSPSEVSSTVWVSSVKLLIHGSMVKTMDLHSVNLSSTPTGTESLVVAGRASDDN